MVQISLHTLSSPPMPVYTLWPYTQSVGFVLLYLACAPDPAIVNYSRSETADTFVTS
jgi:hypothetical protein